MQEAFALLANGQGAGAADTAPDNLPWLRKVVESAGPLPPDGRQGRASGQPPPDAPRPCETPPPGALASGYWKWIAGALAAVVVLLVAFAVGLATTRPQERRENGQTAEVHARETEPPRQETPRLTLYPDNSHAAARLEQEEESRRQLAATERARQEQEARQAAVKAEQQE